MHHKALTSAYVFGNYPETLSPDKRRMYVLWKHNSYCAAFQRYGYCTCRKAEDCQSCNVHISANSQLAKIDAGVDQPNKKKEERHIYITNYGVIQTLRL